MPYELIELMKQLGMPNTDEIVSKAIFYNSGELQKSFEEDTINGFLAFLQEFITNKDYNSCKEYLIRSKYYTSFIKRLC